MNDDDLLAPETQVRHADPDTSHEAAAKLGNQTINHKRVLHLLRATATWDLQTGRPSAGGLTDLELLHEWQRIYGQVPESTPRKRRCDLVRMGRVAKKRDSGGAVIKRHLDGSNRIVWILGDLQLGEQPKGFDVTTDARL